MVQDILSSMDSDEVNSISDTTESLQIANIIKTTYRDLVTELELPDEYTLFQLSSSGDSDKPVTMTIPNGIVNCEWIKYNKVSTTDTRQQFREITYLPKEEFLVLVNSYNSSATNTIQFTLTESGVDFELLVHNDKAPEYYTTFDERTIVFNSYNVSVDSTLQSSKTICYGKKDFSFTLEDTFVPFTEKRYESLLFNASKALAFAELKQMTNNKAEKAERRGRIKTQSSKHAVPHGRSAYDQIHGYGRRN